VANDSDTLVEKLLVALRDPEQATWNAQDPDELSDIIVWSVASMYPHLARQLDPSDPGSQVTLVTDQTFYPIPAAFLEVYRLDRLDEDDNEAGPVADGTWEIVGSLIDGLGQLHVATSVVNQLGTLRLYGFGRYDDDNAVPDDYVPIVLARARAEAFRRVVSNRERFTAWLVRNQTQNISVNELLQMVNEADAEAERLYRRFRTARQPVPGRLR
jgi:hypothetical protein